MKTRTLLSVCVLSSITYLATACGPSEGDAASLTRSLTGDDYTGHKYYLGWGAAGSGDPSMMHNEVKYDVLHTHDVFTAQVGGSYVGTKEIGSQVNGSTIRGHWTRLGQMMTADDMFVQYSSGHGSQSGLGVGVSYDQIRDNALGYPAKEIIIFTMACYSGNLVDSFNRARSRWENFGEQGRTLLVMGSSASHDTSSTGPGTDPDQPNSPYGSAGSAYGHALWKALIGYADGYVDGVKDNYLSLEEIVEFTKWKTQQVGGHDPQVTGLYNPALIMNRVPPRAFVEALEARDGGTGALSDEEVMARVQELDASQRIN
jgi:hypothetical protein